VLSLRREGHLRAVEIEALVRFGYFERPPDKRCEDEKPFVRPWTDALDRLTAPLAAKGIIAVESTDHDPGKTL